MFSANEPESESIGEAKIAGFERKEAEFGRKFRRQKQGKRSELRKGRCRTGTVRFDKGEDFFLSNLKIQILHLFDEAYKFYKVQNEI